MNIAPADADVWDIRKLRQLDPRHAGRSGPRSAELQATGLADVVRRRWPDTQRVFTYWDYRAGAFHQDLGMRIDLVLAGEGVAARSRRPGWTGRPARAAGRATTRR